MSSNRLLFYQIFPLDMIELEKVLIDITETALASETIEISGSDEDGDCVGDQEFKADLNPVEIKKPIYAKFDLMSYQNWKVLTLELCYKTLESTSLILTCDFHYTNADHERARKREADAFLNALRGLGSAEEQLESSQYKKDDRVTTGISKSKENSEAESKKTKRGRPSGSLSSFSLEGGTKVEDILPFLRMAKRAREAPKGSFKRICEEHGHLESTVRSWLKNYSHLL